MKHNGPMGLIDRIFKGGNQKAAAPAERASTQFYESEPDSEDSQADRNAPRRELVQVVLRDTMRKHGIPSDWVDCRILSTVSRSGRRGLHVNFVVRQAHDRLLPYVFAFQDSFERELARFEPRCRDWLLSLGWEFLGVNAAEMPDAKSWSQPGRPLPAASAQETAAAAAAREEATAKEKSDEEIQRDLQALFAIRDAALADAAAKPVPPENDFQPTQPFDEDKPKA